MPYKNPEDAKAWREANKERLKAYDKVWREANKEEEKIRQKARYEANPEKEKARVKAWYEANKDKLNAKDAKKRAAKLNRTPGWLTKEDLDKIESIYIEAGRKTKKTGEEWHVDHIIPLQGKNISGLHVPDNLQILRATENKSKYNRYEI